VSTISTHVLDTASGRPAAGITVRLEHVAPTGTAEIARATTDAAGRIASMAPELIEPGTYRMIFDTGGYLARQIDGPSGSATGGQSGQTGPSALAFFPEVAVTFVVADAREHYHVPLLMSPFGYTTYRGT
jgi:5-hydroxyisourate hydrolase